MSTPRVFVCYSHKDEKWRDRLVVHLLGAFTPEEIWADTNIEAGQRWRERIDAALQNIVVAILLVSPDFMASEFIKNEELPHLLKRAREGGVRILPIILKPSGFTRHAELSALQAVNDADQPLVDATEGEQARILERVTELAERLVQGAKLREDLRGVEDLQRTQRSQLHELRLLLPLLLPADEQRHLLNLKQQTTEGYRGNSSLRKELRRLRSIGLIDRIGAHHIGELKSGGTYDLSQYVRLTPSGTVWAERIQQVRAFEEEE